MVTVIANAAPWIPSTSLLIPLYRVLTRPLNVARISIEVLTAFRFCQIFPVCCHTRGCVFVVTVLSQSLCFFNVHSFKQSGKEEMSCAVGHAGGYLASLSILCNILGLYEQMSWVFNICDPQSNCLSPGHQNSRFSI